MLLVLFATASLAAALGLEPEASSEGRPNTAVRCPDAARVRARLLGLGVDPAARDGRARWRIDGTTLHLRVEVPRARTSTRASADPAGEGSAALDAPAVTERDLPLAPCDELTEAVALAIERATAPLGPLHVERRPMSGLLATPSPAAWRFAAYGGPTLLVSSPTRPGLDVGGAAWPEDGALGLAVALGASSPASFSARTSGLDLLRLHAAAGPMVRASIGEGLEAGAEAALVVEYLHGEPSGLASTSPVRDLRLGGALGPFVCWQVGHLSVRLAATLRVFGGERTYRAVPATALVTLPALEGFGWLALGWASREL